MFNNEELLELLSDIDRYNNALFTRTKNSSFRFIKLKLIEKFPDLSDNKIQEIINDFSLKTGDFKKSLYSLYSENNLEEQEQELYKKISKQNNIMIRQLDRFNKKYKSDYSTLIHEFPRFSDDYKYNVTLSNNNNSLYSKYPKYYPLSKEEEDNDYSIPDSQPSWLMKDEQIFYKSLSNEDKKTLLINYDLIKLSNTSLVSPLRFQVINSCIPIKTKVEIFNKLQSSGSSLLGENTKYNNLVKAILTIPFEKYTPLPVNKDDISDINIYLTKCMNLFDEEVYGHQKIKNEFITMIGSWITAGASTQFGNVIGITGPIGVGKTTLIKEGLSKALNRPFCFISLGGTSHSSLLQGHNYTYEGSSFGEIARGLIESKCMDPIFYFDELDKVSTESRGEEIIHSLIHLTDPAQNSDFHDRYFSGIDLDVSKALFVFSYNNAHKVNPILRDRIHEIILPDFTSDEKIDIAKYYILPKISKGMNINYNNLIKFDKNTLNHLIKLVSETTGMRALKLVLVRLLRIFNLINITGGSKVLNINKNLIKDSPPYNITEDIIEEIFNFCYKDSLEKNNPSNSYMYL